MNIMMFIIFLVTDFICIGAFSFVYKSIDEYKEGMVFGIHVPREALEEDDVKDIREKFRKNYKLFSRVNWILGIGLCFLNFLSFGIFMGIWLLWMIEYCAAAIWLSVGNMRKMYQIKMKHNWIMGEQQNLIHIDTKLSAKSDKLMYSPKWHIPSFLIFIVEILLVLFFNKGKENQNLTMELSMLISLFAFSLLMYALHIFYVSRKNKVYSKDSEINLIVNQVWKKTWSITLLLTNYCNLLGVTYLFYRLLKNDWIGNADIYIYLIFCTLSVFILLAGAYYIKYTTKGILSLDTQELVIDDDVYWKNGWYYNPNDKSLLVQNRINAMNMSFNFARPLAKGIMIAAALLVLFSGIMVGALSYSSDHANIVVTQSENKIFIKGSFYHETIDKQEVTEVKVLSNVPKDSYIRTNGMSTDTVSIGHFRGREIGTCEMYLYIKYKPILEIKTKDKLIFVNSKDKTKVEEWYAMLK